MGVDDFSSLRRPEEHFEPARTAVDTLPAVLRTPALGEAQTDGVRVEGSVLEQRVANPCVVLCHGPGEYLERVAGRDLEHAEGPRVGEVEGGGVDEDRHLRPVVSPHTIVVVAQYQTWEGYILKNWKCWW